MWDVLHDAPAGSSSSCHSTERPHQDEGETSTAAPSSSISGSTAHLALGGDSSRKNNQQEAKQRRGAMCWRYNTIQLLYKYQPIRKCRKENWTSWMKIYRLKLKMR